MNTDLSQSEIDELEQVLSNVSNEWEIKQNQRAVKWRVTFLLLSSLR